MSVPLISHPFRLAGDGSVATEVQDTDIHNAEQIAVVALTRPGERVLVPEFGMTDPTFDNDINVLELQSQIDTFGPPVIIEDVDIDFEGDTVMSVILTFD